MKQVCAYGNLATEGSYFCTTCNRNCPPASLSLIFDPGETFNDLVIIKLIALLGMASVYQARRGNQTILLKIAHRGYENALKVETELLSQYDHPAFLRLLSVYPSEQRRYGKFTIRNEVKYYAIFEDTTGVTLAKWMQQHPQCPPQTAAHLIISLADLVAYLHVKANKQVLTLTPDSILVQQDESGILRARLLDMMGAVPLGTVPVKTHRLRVYMAPEQAHNQPCSVVTDVYALGAMLYELLIGQPIFDERLLTDVELRTAIDQHDPPLLNTQRPELNRGVSTIVQQSLQKEPRHRQPDVRTFAKSLRTLFGEVPSQPKLWHINRRVIAALVFGLVLGLLLLLFLILGQS